MSKYEELYEAFTESIKRNHEHVNHCCEFVNSLFEKMSAYSGWPQDRIGFSKDKHPQALSPTCHREVVSLGKDGYVYSFAHLTVRRNDNAQRHYTIIIPIKVKKFEDSFNIKINDIEADYLLSESDTEEQEKFFEYTFERMKRHFDTPSLNWDVPGVLGDTGTEGKDEWEE